MPNLPPDPLIQLAVQENKRHREALLARGIVPREPSVDKWVQGAHKTTNPNTGVASWHRTNNWFNWNNARHIISQEDGSCIAIDHNFTNTRYAITPGDYNLVCGKKSAGFWRTIENRMCKETGRPYSLVDGLDLTGGVNMRKNEDAGRQWVPDAEEDPEDARWRKAHELMPDAFERPRALRPIMHVADGGDGKCGRIVTRQPRTFQGIEKASREYFGDPDPFGW